MELLQAFAMIFIAEMGDKTQILAMAFATKYKIRDILIGVAIGSLLNHGLAIILGSLLTRVIPIDLLQVIAGTAFLVFAMLSLTVDEDDEEENTAKKMGPVFTVALAFFIGELGDKTQLTALTLSTGATYPALILAGTVLGMVATSAVGIFVGSRIGNKIPEFQLKLGAFAIFMFFGLQKLLTSPYTSNVDINQVLVAMALLSVLSFVRIRGFRRQLAQVEESRFARQAEELHRHWLRMASGLNDLCLSTEVCGQCDGDGCLVGFMKTIVQKEINGDMVDDGKFSAMEELLHKDYNPIMAEQILKDLMTFYEAYPDHYENHPSHDLLRKALERIAFGAEQPIATNYEAYKKQVEAHFTKRGAYPFVIQ